MEDVHKAKRVGDVKKDHSDGVGAVKSVAGKGVWE